MSCHRYHHLHCETPLDPHSVYEGFWWSHMGWLLDDQATQSRVFDTSNAKGACLCACACAAVLLAALMGRKKRQQCRWISGHRHAAACCSEPNQPQRSCAHAARTCGCVPASPPADMANDPFYAHLNKHYTWHVVGQFLALYLLGGWDALIW